MEVHKVKETTLSIIRYLVFIVGLFASLPFLVFIFLLPTTPITSTGCIYLIACLVIVSGLISTPWLRRGSLALSSIGGVLIIVTVLLRMAFPPLGSHIILMTLPDQSGPRWLNRIFDEQDFVLFGARLGPYLRLVTKTESNGLVPAFVEARNKMGGATTLSPFLMTYLNQESPTAFDVIVDEPSNIAQPKRGIIFIHGFGGNFTLQCWLVAYAGERVGALTACPSTSPIGDWWSPQGEVILRQTLAYMHRRGVQRIYLAGLSNGGIGASRLANRFTSEIAGLILISGADPDAPVSRLPVLVIQGEGDERIPARMVERYVTVAGAAATYLPLEGDHFVLLKRVDQVQDTIVNWILKQEQIGPWKVTKRTSPKLYNL
jgi:pimeloyl-ACP methyl ester carboxylesterase